MRNYNNDMIAAINKFKEAYDEMNACWHNLINTHTGEVISLDDTKAIRHYPFDKSFDEYSAKLHEWAIDTIEELGMTPRCKSPISSEDIHNLLRILREKRDDIGCLSVHTVDVLYDRLTGLEYNENVKEFYDWLINSLPFNEDNNDEEWDKWYSQKIHIMYGDRSITLNNEATLYNYMVDMFRFYINCCL